MPYVTDNITLYDKPIYKSIQFHIQKFGFVTIKQCANIFYSNSKFPYTEAQRTLNKMVKGKLIKSSKAITSENIYYTSKVKNSYHSIMKMNIYSMFVKAGFEIVNISREPTQFKIKRADILMDIAKPNGQQIFPLFIEVDNYNDTNIKNIEKLYDSGQVQHYYYQRYEIGVFPTVIIVTNKVKREYSDKFKIIYLDHNLNNFSDFFNINNY